MPRIAGNGFALLSPDSLQLALLGAVIGVRFIAADPGEILTPIIGGGVHIADERAGLAADIDKNETPAVMIRRFDRQFGPAGNAGALPKRPERPMLELPAVTLVCIDCERHALALAAIEQTMHRCRFAEVLFVTDRDPGIDVLRV